jgi:hypothetical protein
MLLPLPEGEGWGESAKRACSVKCVTPASLIDNNKNHHHRVGSEKSADHANGAMPQSASKIISLALGV